MAAQLKDEGRFPAVQKLRKAEFNRFVEACEKPKAPTEGLKQLMGGQSRKK